MEGNNIFGGQRWKAQVDKVRNLDSGDPSSNQAGKTCLLIPQKTDWNGRRLEAGLPVQRL